MYGRRDPLHCDLSSDDEEWEEPNSSEHGSQHTQPCKQFSFAYLRKYYDHQDTNVSDDEHDEHVKIPIEVD